MLSRVPHHTTPPPPPPPPQSLFCCQLKLRNVATTQQEKLLGEKDAALGKQVQENQGLSKSLAQKDEEVVADDFAFFCRHISKQNDKPTILTTLTIVGGWNTTVVIRSSILIFSHQCVLR